MTQKPLTSLNLLTAIDILFEKFYKLTKSNNYLKSAQHGNNCSRRFDFNIKNSNKDKVFTLNDLLEMHKQITDFAYTSKSGRFRQHQVIVGNYAPPAAYLVKPLMNEFIDWLNERMSSHSTFHWIELAALAHIKLVNIHPFYDGNGRTGRMLMNLILMKFGYLPLVIIKEEKNLYNEYMSQANKGNSELFVNCIANLMLIKLKEFIECN